MTIPPRQLSVMSAVWSEQSIEALSSPAEYSVEELATQVVFDQSALLDVAKFKQTVYFLKNLYDSVDFKEFWSSLYASLANALYPWGPLPFDFPEGCRSVALLTPQIARFSRLVQLSVKCLSERVETLTIFTPELPDSSVFGVLQPWLLREVRGHYPAELVEVSVVDNVGLRVETFSSTGEKNSELMIWFRSGEIIEEASVDLVISEVPLGGELNATVATMDEVLV